MSPSALLPSSQPSRVQSSVPGSRKPSPQPRMTHSVAMQMKVSVSSSPQGVPSGSVATSHIPVVGLQSEGMQGLADTQPVAQTLASENPASVAWYMCSP